MGNQAANRAAKSSIQNKDLIGVVTLVPHINLSEILSYTEVKLYILKAKSEGCQEDHMGWFQKERLLFLPGTSNGSWLTPYIPLLI